MSRNVAFLIFNDVEVLDFSGSFEVFGAAGGREQGERPFSVYTVADKARPVQARYGLSVNPRYSSGAWMSGNAPRGSQPVSDQLGEDAGRTRGTSALCMYRCSDPCAGGSAGRSLSHHPFSGF